MPDSHISEANWRVEVEGSLRTFLEHKTGALEELSPDANELLKILVPRISEGKRLRPAFVVAGWIAGGGTDSPALWPLAASCELVQLSALIHDDLIDDSDHRRGLPSAHRAFERLGSESFGRGAAILLGDLCLVWASELFESAALPAQLKSAARFEFQEMLTEVTVGQYLDLLNSELGKSDLTSAYRVIELKTSKYTVERPLRIGAAAAGANREFLNHLSEYALPLGVSFQLRDDLLGVFGDPQITGKPAGDDLREGKRTVLIAEAFARCTDSEASQLAQSLGNQSLSDEELNRARTILQESGAVAEVEQAISTRLATAESILEKLTIDHLARQRLQDLAIALTARVR